MNVPRTLATKSRKRAIDGMQPFFVLAFVSRATSFSNASIQMWIKQIYSLCVGKVLQLLDGNNVQAGRLSYRGRKRSYISVPAPTRIALSWAESYVREESLSPPPPYAAGGTHPLERRNCPEPNTSASRTIVDMPGGSCGDDGTIIGVLTVDGCYSHSLAD